jgi:demethoxyubiquinone hydroxylase (CLK1/Coq7/Cat5 family)
MHSLRLDSSLRDETRRMGTERRQLIRLLRRAHADERGAALAYRGHARSQRGGAEHAALLRIEAEEWAHRRCLAGLLVRLGARPLRLHAWAITAIGWTLGKLCHVTGYLAPMYGAGLIERINAADYYRAARLAAAAGCVRMVPLLQAMAESEARHAAYFRERVRAHALGRWLPLWSDGASGNATDLAEQPLSATVVT